MKTPCATSLLFFCWPDWTARVVLSGMATKRGLTVWRCAFLGLLAGSCVVGCSGNETIGGTCVNAASTPDGGPRSSGTPSEAAGPGWSIRDATPYSRTEHATVLDEARDRMLVIGGLGGLDVWALPLSGPGQQRWAQIQAGGDAPPVLDLNTGGAVSAIYDPFGQRVLVLRADSYQFTTPRIWELTLDDSPTWHELTLEGPAPGAQLDQGKMVVDRSGKRVLIVGGGLNTSGTWALSLDGPARWSRVADAPIAEVFPNSIFFLGINVSALFVDAPRERLVLIAGAVRASSHVWTLPLAGGEWALEASGACGADYDTTSTYDSTHDRVIFVGGDCGLSSYSLANGEWQSSHASNWFANRDSYSSSYAVSSIDDPQRGRALFFSGGFCAGNATTMLSYDDLKLSTLVPNTLGIGPGGTTGVWDEQRQALVAFGASDGGVTNAHGWAADDRWRDVAGPQPPWSVGVYDAIGQAVIAVGHPDLAPSSEIVARLSSAPGSEWRVIPASGGPELRDFPVAVYDSARQRLVLHGGQATGYPPAKWFDDTWALSLTGDPEWTVLVTSGNSGGARSRQAAIFDPIGQRMITYGGTVDISTNDGPRDLHQLTLDDSLQWSEIQAAGTGPANSYGMLAVYDAPGERMLVLDKGHLFALTLRGDPVWHRFCELGIGMPGSLPLFVSSGAAAPLLGVAPDGLFAALGDGTFRFDLATPYCD